MNTFATQINSIKNAEINLLTTMFGGQNKVAEVLSVNKSRVTRWKKGEKPDNANLLKLAGLNYLISILLTVYNREAAFKWLCGTNPLLDNSVPLDLLKEDRYQEVIDAAMETIAGSYA